MRELIKKIWYYGWAQAGFIKIMGAIAVFAILAIIYRVTEIDIFWKIGLFGPGIYIGIYAIVSLVYAWIIWPITEIKKKIKERKK